jgi:hypothetical protein
LHQVHYQSTTLRHPPVHRQQPAVCKIPPLRCTPRSVFQRTASVPRARVLNALRSPTQPTTLRCHTLTRNPVLPSRATTLHEQHIATLDHLEFRIRTRVRRNPTTSCAPLRVSSQAELVCERKGRRRGAASTYVRHPESSTVTDLLNPYTDTEFVIGNH